MKKIMFNDKYGLTAAVLNKIKTQTRRIIPPVVVEHRNGMKEQLSVSRFDDSLLWVEIADGVDYVADAKYQPKYLPGDEVAVAQPYCGIYDSEAKFRAAERKVGQILEAGYRNKMFVRADLMPHRIRITSVRLERLQDISDADCIREGVFVRQICKERRLCMEYFLPGNHRWVSYSTPRDAFAALIDKTSGKGTWERNPLVYVYDFKLKK